MEAKNSEAFGERPGAEPVQAPEEVTDLPGAGWTREPGPQKPLAPRRLKSPGRRAAGPQGRQLPRRGGAFCRDWSDRVRTSPVGQ